MTTEMEAPATVNNVYKMAANWVRTEAVMSPGQAKTFLTTGLDNPIHKQKKTRGKKVEGSEDIKKNRNVECYRCGEQGHYADKCPN